LGVFVKNISVIFVLVFSSSCWGFAVTSLNLEWFGRGGEKVGQEQDEYRHGYVRDFLLQKLPASDVFVFQEVVDVGALKDTFHEFSCASYDENNQMHQHVVICWKNSLHLVASEVIESVRLGSSGLRPALKVILSDGNFEVSLYGVHLKAGRSYTKKRQRQVFELSKVLGSEQKVIIVGDFNTFTSDRTQLEKDDHIYMDEILTPLSFTSVDVGAGTFVERPSRVLDRAWYRGLSLNRSDVYGPCVDQSVEPPYSLKSFFTRFVSDHCALRLEVSH
jgi:hypothetical protein